MSIAEQSIAQRADSTRKRAPIVATLFLIRMRTSGATGTFAISSNRRNPWHGLKGMVAFSGFSSETNCRPIKAPLPVLPLPC